MKLDIKLVEITASIKAETPNAYLLEFGERKPLWFPKSQVEDNRDGTFTMPEWLAIDKGAV